METNVSSKILAAAGRTEYDRSIFEMAAVRDLILRESFNEDTALSLLNRLQLAAWTVFRGRKYIVFTEVSPLIGVARATPKTYLSTHASEMAHAGAKVLRGDELKEFFEVTGKRALIAGAHVSSLSVYTPESILLMAMIAKRIARCRDIQKRIAQHLGLVPYQQDMTVEETETETAEERVMVDGIDVTGEQVLVTNTATGADGFYVAEAPIGRPLGDVLEEEGLLEGEEIPNLADILDKMEDVQEMLEATPQGTVTVPLHEGLSASTFIQGEVEADDVIDFFRKYEAHLSEGTQGIIYCVKYSNNAWLASELITQAGYKLQIAALHQ